VNGFHLIVIDPPWESRSAARRQRFDYMHVPDANSTPAKTYCACMAQLCNSYHTIPNYDLFRLPVKDLLASEVALVALWVTNRPRFIDFAQTDLFAAWGLTPVARWFWMKVLPLEQEAANVLEVTCAHGASAAQSLGPPQDDGQVRAGRDPARPRTPPVRGAADRRAEPIGGGGAR